MGSLSFLTALFGFVNRVAMAEEGGVVDGNRFDQLTRALAGERSRRGLLKALVGGVTAGLSGALRPDDSEAAAVCRQTGEVCRKGGDCCTKKCSPPDRYGRNRCYCAVTGDCPPPATGCLKVSCTGGNCVTANACASGQVCYQKACCTPNSNATTCQNNCGKVVTNNCGQTVVCPPCCTANGGGCTANPQCCSGVCVNGSCATGASGTGGACDETADCQSGLLCCAATACHQCCQTSDCSGQDTECATYSCTSGSCTPSYTTNGTATSQQTAGDCQKNVCDGSGNIISVADNSDVPPDDGNQCTFDTCSSGQVAHPFKPVNSPCNQNDGSVCDSAGHCVQCNSPSQCPGQDTACQSRTCVNNVCGVANTANGTPTSSQTPGDCQQTVCNGQGGTSSIADNNDVPTAINDCDIPSCSGGSAVHTPKDSGQICSSNDGKVCDGEGNCVACVQDSDCTFGNICCSNQCVAATTTNCGCGVICATGQLCNYFADDIPPQWRCCATSGTPGGCFTVPCCPAYLGGTVGDPNCSCVAGAEGEV